jgi:microcin C transport system substrate-binding protein
VFLNSQAAKMEGSRNLSGVADPVVDALIERIVHAATRDDLNVACRVLDRVMRTAHYWVPMWYSDAVRAAYWDAFSRPAIQPKLGVGAPDTWWWDEDKAKKIGL